MIDQLSLQLGRLQAERTVLARRCERLTIENGELAAENQRLRAELADADQATCDDYFAAIERGAEANRRRAQTEVDR